MLAVQVSGTISKTPETRTTTKGNPVAFSSVRIQSPDGDTYASITAFDSGLVDILTRLKPGDPVTVIGSGKLSSYTTKNGETRPSLSVTASRPISITDIAQPPRQHPKRTTDKPLPETEPAGADFGDNIPY